MNSLNFDEACFRRVVSKSELTEPVPSVARLLSEATEKFYDEFDYYPNLAVCAPGTFTILGEYMELFGGLVVQAALPFVTLVVGRAQQSLKMRAMTYSDEVDEPNRIIFPAWQCRKLKKGIPKWANLLKGINNYFIRKNTKGLDVIIYSSIPVSRGFGSSAALESAFYSVMEGLYNREQNNVAKTENARKCRLIDETFGESSIGSYSVYTSYLAETKKALVINTGDETVEFLHFHDPNILFLLSMPEADFLRHPQDLIQTRITEIKLAAKLLDLDDIKYAEERHLEVLVSDDDPSREEVIAILREFETDEKYIAKFIEELFRLPEPESESCCPEEFEYIGEYGETVETIGKLESENEVPDAGESFTAFEYKTVCDETVFCAGLSDLSARSNVSVMSKLLRRVRYIVTEQMRVREMIRFINDLDYISAGMEITRSHLSLKVDFEMSSPVIDQLVELTAEFGNGVFGSKMMRNGGTLTLLHRNQVHSLIESIKDRFGDSFKFYLVFPSCGLRKLSAMPLKVPQSSLSQKCSSVEELLRKAIASFEAIYQRHPTHGYYAPGAVKLLGDHSDYGQTHVLSMAMNMVTLIVGAVNGSGKVRAATSPNYCQQPQKVIFQLPPTKAFKPEVSTWANYVQGTINYFRGCVPGFDCLIESNIPINGKVSGSASLQVAMYGFLEELTGEYTENETEKAGRCMRGEHDFTYTLRGVDEFIVAMKGLENKMIMVDCNKSTFTLLPSFDPSLVFVLVHTVNTPKTSKSLVYMRLEECYDVAKALGLKSLRCVTEEALESVRGVSEVALKRARHIIQEEKRVIAGAEALRKFDPEKFGRLMVESHISLRDNFEISQHESDEAVERAMEVEGVLGARMADIEFGGSVVCLVKKWAVDDLIEYIQYSCSTAYDYYVMTPAEGSKSLDIRAYIDSLPGPKKTFKSVLGY